MLISHSGNCIYTHYVSVLLPLNVSFFLITHWWGDILWKLWSILVTWNLAAETNLCPTHCTPIYAAPEKEMATRSRVLAWRIPGMGEPGELPFMGSHRVEHDWSDTAAAAAAEIIRVMEISRYLSFIMCGGCINHKQHFLHLKVINGTDGGISVNSILETWHVSVLFVNTILLWITVIFCKCGCGRHYLDSSVSMSSSFPDTQWPYFPSLVCIRKSHGTHLVNGL